MIVYRLREVLEAKGMTRGELSRRSGIPYQTLHAVYHNQTKGIRFEVLDRLCEVLDADPGELLVRVKRR